MARADSPGEGGTGREALVVAVAGGTGSGKSLFARALAQRLAPRSVVLISEDDYYRRIDEADFDPRSFDFDAPSALDHRLLAAQLGELRAGRAVDRPVYSFRIHAPLKRRVRVGPAEVVILEGLHVLHDPEVRGQVDFSVFLEVADDIRFIRRLRRDTRERGRSVKSVTEQYLRTVRPAHQRYIAPARSAADLVLAFEPERGETAELERWLREAMAALAAR